MVIIGGFLIDVAPTEGHNYDSASTDHPIEDGADITDHIRVLPDRITIEGIVSNTPIGEVKSIRDNESPFAGEILPASDALAYLKQLRENREPVEVETSLGKHENMVLINLSVPRNTSTGDSFRFRAEFKEAQIIKTERERKVTVTARAQVKTRRGAKTSEPVEESSKLQDYEQFIHQQRRRFGMPFDGSKL